MQNPNRAEPEFSLAPLFQAVGQSLRSQQQHFNQADSYNGNHGDHMVQIFELAARAVQQERELELAPAMEQAAGLLWAQADNGSAQVYARGLECLAAQFRKYEVSLEELVVYTRGALSKEKRVDAEEAAQAKRSGNVLKALTAGLAAWGQVERGQTPSNSPLDMGTLFEFGMAYLQAKGRGRERAEVLADAAASVSPLSGIPHRYQSGKLAILALLHAMQDEALSS